jgi:hypothetical protein
VAAKSEVAKVLLCCPTGQFWQDTRSACADLGLDDFFKYFWTQLVLVLHKQLLQGWALFLTHMHASGLLL